MYGKVVSSHFYVHQILIYASNKLRYLLHDPQVYKDPLSFDPTRFLGDQSERDPRLIAFGFGRRLCPGATVREYSCVLILTRISCRRRPSRHFNVPSVCSDSGGLRHKKGRTRRQSCWTNLWIWYRYYQVCTSGFLIDVSSTESLASHPKPFACSIKPRSEKAQELIFAE